MLSLYVVLVKQSLRLLGIGFNLIQRHRWQQNKLDLDLVGEQQCKYSHLDCLLRTTWECKIVCCTTFSLTSKRPSREFGMKAYGEFYTIMAFNQNQLTSCKTYTIIPKVQSLWEGAILNGLSKQLVLDKDVYYLQICSTFIQNM